LRRTSNISADLCPPLQTAKAKTRRILNKLEEVATNKREPNFRDLLHKGKWKYRDEDFTNVPNTLKQFEIDREKDKKAHKVLPRNFDTTEFPKNTGI
jgi:hypothetical protein